MGGRDSSSKRKERRDKISSKKKSRRKESKKRRCNYDSSSDDDSLYLRHSSFSTSKTDHKRKRAKHKKPRRGSSVSDYSDSDSSSTDDHEYKSRKARRSRISLKDTKRKGRKRSIRDNDTRPTKKSSKKKELSSSDSESCSTCQSGSSSSGADDKRRRNITFSSKEKGRGRLRGRGSDKGRQKHKDRSPSCTSIRGSSPALSVGKCGEEFFPVNNSRRLRSVITVVNQLDNEEVNRLEKEILYDQNEYPSPKSLDNNEGGSKTESDDQFNVAFSDRICVEDEEVAEVGKSRIDESEGGYSEAKKMSKSIPIAASGGDDLESTLRQKALENLRMFRERPQTRINNESNVARLSDSISDTVQTKSIEQGSEMNQTSGLLLQREIAEVDKKKPGLAKLDITNSFLQPPEEDKSGCSRVAGDNNGELTSTEPTPGSDQTTEAKDSSQFEQKTMSVMRGGELVQVSYKVYIPKKAPAPARRQLRR